MYFCASARTDRTAVKFLLLFVAHPNLEIGNRIPREFHSVLTKQLPCQMSTGYRYSSTPFPLTRTYAETSDHQLTNTLTTCMRGPEFGGIELHVNLFRPSTPRQYEQRQMAQRSRAGTAGPSDTPR